MSPLFICDGCGALENTALGRFWGEKPGDKKCSECATGTWHGRWPKNEPTDPGNRLIYRPAARPRGDQPKEGE